MQNNELKYVTKKVFQLTLDFYRLVFENRPHARFSCAVWVEDSVGYREGPKTCCHLSTKRLTHAKERAYIR